MFASGENELVILAARSEYLLSEFSVQIGPLPAEMKLKNPNLSC
jgi:hypothetical protein